MCVRHKEAHKRATDLAHKFVYSITSVIHHVSGYAMYTNTFRCKQLEPVFESHFSLSKINLPDFRIY